MIFALTGLYLELFGYVGTALVVISMLMTSINKLRIINICGSIISCIYSVLVKAYPVAIMNLCLILINVFHLIRSYIKSKNIRKESV